MPKNNYLNREQDRRIQFLEDKFATINSEMGNVKTDIGIIKADIKNIDRDVKCVREDFKAIQKNLTGRPTWSILVMVSGLITLATSLIIYLLTTK